MSWGLFSLGMLIDYVRTWTSFWDGLLAGLIHVVFFFSVAFAVWILPLNLIVLGLYRWRKWTGNSRLVGAMLPSVLIFLAVSIYALAYPQKSKERFARFVGASVPTGATGFRAFHSGGGVTDYSDYYYFECEPAELEGLLNAAQFEARDGREVLREDGKMWAFASLPPDWPQPAAWDGFQVYRLHDKPRKGWGAMLITDKDRHKVIVSVWCI